MNTHSFLSRFSQVLVVVAASEALDAAPRYQVTDLGTLGGSFSQGLSVNDAGQVAGLASTATNSAIQAALSTGAANFQNAIPLDSGIGVATGINSLGSYIGTVSTAGGPTPSAFLVSNIGTVSLGTLGGSGSNGRGINEQGDVTGFAEISGNAAEHAFLFRDGLLQDLGTLGGNDSQGNAINNAGQITGWSDVAGDTGFHAFRWQAGQFTDLETLGGSFGEGLSINSAGSVAGYSTLPGDGIQHAALWKPGEPIRDLGSLGGKFSIAYSVNGNHQVVGSSTTAGDLNRHAYVWNGSLLEDLNSLIPDGSNIILTEARGISENGFITGAGKVGAELHAFLLTPDRVAPALTCPANITTTGGQPAAIGQATASDNLDPAPVITSNQPASFPLGETPVTWTATDAAGNRASCVQRVRLPALRINDVAKAEGNSGTTPYTFTVSLLTPAMGTVTVDWATADSSALAGTDYSAAAGTLSFAPGQTSQTVTVNAIGDTILEANETFTVNLSGAAGAAIADGQGVGTLLNDEGPLLRINDVAKAEGNAGITPYTFTVSLSPASAAPVTVNWATANASALANSDYSAASGSLSFAPGQTSQTVTVNGIGDTVLEGNEAFVVNLSAATGATIFDSQGVGTLLNDEGPLLRINDVAKAEGNSGVNAYTFTVSLSPAAVVPVTVNWASANSSAVAGSDYTAAAGSLSFAPGHTSKTITVNATGDTLLEGNEAFVVNLSAATGATIFDSQGVGTLLNDEGPLLRINDVSKAEGNAGINAYAFTVSLSPAATMPVTVNWASANSSALAGSDYVAASGSLNFAPGETTKTITIAAMGDTTVEANEMFAVNLGGAVGATLFDSQGLGSLINDDL
ncbi:MAG: HYR domain-containing protein [Methylococcaceae bacterium]|nr:HYR domain-containing protein [Methylococcaceae bacterium]